MAYFQYNTQAQILSELGAVDTSYMAVAVHNKPIQIGRMNGVRFCNHLLVYLSEQFPERFSVYENTRINWVELGLDHHLLHHDQGKVLAKELVLCTNGYKNFRLINKLSQKDFVHLHQVIIPREGYLGAYLGNSYVPNANAFFRDDEFYADVPYWYLSQLPSGQHLQQSINFWLGVMGYTQTGLRWVISDSYYPNLWYNLGCNGIGIVPAISGAERLAKLMGVRFYCLLCLIHRWGRLRVKRGNDTCINYK